jgi:hypothetical protein
LTTDREEIDPMAGRAVARFARARQIAVSRVRPDKPSEAPPLDLGEGFNPIAREAIDIGERALTDLRTNTVARWISAGAAWLALQNVAKARSGSNTPAGQRYNRVYAILVHAWPQLAKVGKVAKSHAIWLFENSDAVLAWLATLSQKEWDRWLHPQTIRRHYERRHPNLLAGKPSPHRFRERQHREWSRVELGERTREDLEAIIQEFGKQLAERDHEIAELQALLADKDREIARLKNELLWEQTARHQAETALTLGRVGIGITTVPGAGVPIIHAIARESREIMPDPHRPVVWARKLQRALDRAASIPEIEALLADNEVHLVAYERQYPGAGAGLRRRAARRREELLN